MADSYKKIPQEMVDNASLMDKGKELTKPIPANRAASALRLRLDGADFGSIAEALEFDSPAAARRAVERALASTPNDMKEIERVRLLESKRIDRILFSLMRRATNPKDPDHLQYARTALAAIQQQTNLHGAAMPTKVDISYNPSAQQLEAWVGQIAAMKHKDVVEGDIIDIEFVESTPEPVDDKPKRIEF